MAMVEASRGVGEGLRNMFREEQRDGISLAFCVD